MKYTAPYIPAHHQTSAPVARRTSRPIKVTAACVITCLVFGAATGADEGPLKEFAGKYSGQATLSTTGVTAVGTADGSLRGYKVGGQMILRTTVSANGDTIVLNRKLKFKRRSFKSNSLLVSAGTTQIGTGSGRYSSGRNLLRYNENATFTASGSPVTVQIQGKVRFFKRSLGVSEIWAISGGSLSFNYRLRTR